MCLGATSYHGIWGSTFWDNIGIGMHEPVVMHVTSCEPTRNKVNSEAWGCFGIDLAMGQNGQPPKSNIDDSLP